MERAKHRTGGKVLVIYGLVQAFQYASLGVIIPVLSLILLSKGISLAQMGLVMSVSSATIFLLELPTGGLADSIGRKKVYLASRMVTLISLVVLLAVTSWRGLALGIFFRGVARALSSGSLDAWFVDEFNRQNPDGLLQKGLARINMVVLISLGLFTIVGGILPDTPLARNLEQLFPPMGPYGINLMASLILAATGILLTMIIVRDRGPESQVSFKEGFKRVPTILKESTALAFRNRTLILIFLTVLALGIGLSGLEGFWQPRLKGIYGINGNNWLLGIISSGYFLFCALGNLASTPFCRFMKNDYAKVAFTGRLMMGLLFIPLAMMEGIAGFALFYFVLFFHHGLGSSSEGALVQSQIPSDKRSSLMSLESLFLHVGGGTGSIVGGIIAEKWGIPFVWYAAGTVMIISAFLYLGCQMGSDSEETTEVAEDSCNKA